MKRKSSVSMNNRHELLTIAVLKQFRLIYGTVRQHFREVEERVGISGSQVWMIREISDAPGIGVSELATKLSIHQSTCSQLVENLVTDGYVVKARQKGDQRRVGLSLTPSASKILRHAPGPAEGVLPQALSRISSTALRSLSGHLDKVIDELQLRDPRHADKPLADL
jgi:DNA-binding MarR family transcriptional regulator